ncbi:hypothetical protein [Methylobacterium organophilum]|uniref:Uncharacterized protein n=1 Tax=Methylobacterium organophilum TaxID=410 RepID=A0ABQ4THG6_METOR|nr:hypothetical protein [Methylobacterium organophilum]GJE29784.1 hypothetical protein LKMONMHP_4670 [Methylobacterium organophilum]
MAKQRITFEVDSSRLFDAIQEMGGECGLLGQRLVEILLAPKAAGLRTQVGTAFYGVTLVGAELAPATTTTEA